MYIIVLSPKELEIIRKCGRVHQKIFEKIRKELKPGVYARDIDAIAVKMAADAGYTSAFTGVYGYKYALQTSVNDVVVHGRPLKHIIFQEGDVVTVDYGVKDPETGICTDAAFTVIIGKPDDFPKKQEFIKIWEQALQKALEVARAGNHVGDIGHVVESFVAKHGYHIIRDLTGHGVGKSLHEQPYIYNYGKPGEGPILKAGMTLAIEPILGYSSGEIVDHGDWEIYVADGSIGCQFEHTILITDGEPEIIV